MSCSTIAKGPYFFGTQQGYGSQHDEFSAKVAFNMMSFHFVMAQCCTTSFGRGSTYYDKLQCTFMMTFVATGLLASLSTCFATTVRVRKQTRMLASAGFYKPYWSFYVHMENGK